MVINPRVHAQQGLLVCGCACVRACVQACVCACVCVRLCVRPWFFSIAVAAMVVKRGLLKVVCTLANSKNLEQKRQRNGLVWSTFSHYLECALIRDRLLIVLEEE